MKKLLFAVVVIAAGVLSGADVILDESWTIVPEKGSCPFESRFNEMAAKLMQEIFFRSTGKKFAVKPSCSGKKILIGSSQDAPAPQIPWSCQVSFDAQGNLRFSGTYKGSKEHFVSFLQESGTLRGVTEFLRETAGFQAPFPNARAYYCEKRQKIAVPAGFKKLYKPHFLYVNGKTVRDAVYCAANDYLTNVRYKSYGGHSYPKACPNSMFKEHPEYFAMLSSGKRWNGSQYCISNPGLQELVYQELLKQCDSGFEWVQIGQPDGFSLCRCPECKKYGNTDDAGEKLWMSHLKMAERLKKDRPGKKAVIISYHPTDKVPKLSKNFPDNVVIELCNYSEENLKEWDKIKLPKVSYVYNWGGYAPEGLTPRNTPERLVKQIQTLDAHGICGIYRCGFGELFGLEGPNYYIYGQAVKCAGKCDADKLLKSYCAMEFGKAAPEMVKFYRALYARTELKLNRDASVYKGLNLRFPGRYDSLETLSLRYNGKVRRELEKILKAAEAKVPKNILMPQVRWELDFLLRTAELAESYLAYMKNPGEMTFKPMCRINEARVAHLAKWRKLTRSRAYSGFPTPGIWNDAVWHANGSYRGRILYPRAWPLKEMEELKIYPGARTISPDGKAHLLLPATMDKPMGKVQVAMTRDDKNLYFTFSGEKFLPSDWFFIYTDRFCIVSRGKTQGGWVYTYDKVTPQRGATYSNGKRDNRFPSKFADGKLTITLPLALTSGAEFPVNLVWERRTKKGNIEFVFEPDLKILGHRSLDAGRGRCIVKGADR